MSNNTVSVIDLTSDVGDMKAPLELANTLVTREKLLAANDKFFDMFEDCLYLMIVKTDQYYIVHCMAHAQNASVRSMAEEQRLHAQYGWVLAYFQDCEYKGEAT